MHENWPIIVLNFVCYFLYMDVTIVISFRGKNIGKNIGIVFSKCFRTRIWHSSYFNTLLDMRYPIAYLPR
jgi:hypothetical protein